MKRLLFRLFCAFSLVLWVATCLMWWSNYYSGRTFWSRDTIVWQPAPSYPASYSLWSDHGNLCFIRSVCLFFNSTTQNNPPPPTLAGFAFTLRDRDGSMPVEGYPNWFVPRIYLQVPFWFLFLVTLIMPVVFVRRTFARQRFQTAGVCRRCGYDLRATPKQCPECGTPVKPR
jgi:hypothetical protein